MRRLGLLGGMAWPSTADAYRVINEEVARRLGGAHSARLVLWSFDFAEIAQLQAADEWAAAGRALAAAAQRLEAAGAEGLMLCTNTMHRVAPDIESAVDIPLLHIADATATAVARDDHRRVGLLGTRFTMEHDFYRGRLQAHGLDVLVPSPAQRDAVHRIIYSELVQGITTGASRQLYLEVIADLERRGAEGVIAGCTEIELLVGPDDVALPYYATTRLHSLAAVDWMLRSTASADEQPGRRRRLP